MTERLMSRLLGFVLGVLGWNDSAILQIAVYRFDRKEFLASWDNSPTRFAGAPSRREPFALPRGNSLPDKWFCPALLRLPPGGSSRPQAGEGVRVHSGFILVSVNKPTDKPKFETPTKTEKQGTSLLLGFLFYSDHSVFSLQETMARIFACSVSAYSTVRVMPSVTRIRDSSEARAAR